MDYDESRLSAYLDGELGEQEREWLENELTASAQLRHKLDQLRREAEQVSQALDSLSPRGATVSTALALERLLSNLFPDGQDMSVLDHVGSEEPAVHVWESPSLVAEVRDVLKDTRDKRSQAMEGSVLRGRPELVGGIVVLAISIITVTLALLFNADSSPIEFIRPVGNWPSETTESPPSSVSTNPSLNRGIQVDPLGDAEANVGHVKSLGFEWVKLQMPWKIVEPTAENYDWAPWDEAIGTYADNGTQVMLNISKAPDWARPADDDKSVEGLPADPATYAEFVALVAERYQGQVQAIEIWDEQNLWYKAGGMGRIDAEAYVELLAETYQAIKAVDEGVIVISGGMTPAENVLGADNREIAVDDVDYLEQMYAYGFGDYLDVLGVHAPGYNCPALADWQTFEDDTAAFRGPFEARHHAWCFLGPLEAYREVMMVNGNEDKSIWVTEFGWAVSNEAQQGYEYAADNTPEEQAQWIIEALQWAEDQNWVGAMFLWNLDYGLTAPDTALADFGILDTPAYDALVEMNQGKNEER